MKASKLILLSFCTIVIIIAGLFFLMAAGVESTVLNPTHYENMMSKTNMPLYIYQDWEGLIKSQVISDPDEHLHALMLKAFSQGYSEEWLKEQLVLITKDVLAIIKGEQDGLTAVIDLQEGKKLTKESLAAEFVKLSDQELAMLGVADRNLTTEAVEITDDMIDIPDKIALSSLVGKNEIPDEFANVLSAFQKVRQYYLAVPILALIVMLGLSCLSGGAARGLKWSGFAITFTGAGFITALLITGYRFVSSAVLKLDKQIFNNEKVISRMYGYTVNWIVIMCLIYSIIGLIFIYTAWFVEKKKKSGQSPSRRTGFVRAILLCLIVPLIMASCVRQEMPTDPVPSTGIKETVSVEQSGGGGYEMTGDLSLRLAGVTVMPHYVSGEIAEYKKADPFKVPDNLGAFVRIFVANDDLDNSFNGTVLFNGKTGVELLREGIVSWCSVPDIRRLSTSLSVSIPGGAMDCYILNIVDSNFYKDGITLSFADNKTGYTAEGRISVKAPDFYASRILFTSSEGTREPDGFYVYFENESSSDIEVTDITIWSAPGDYNTHWWKNRIKPSGVKWFNGGVLRQGEIGGAHVITGDIPYGESIVQFDIERADGPDKLFYVIKPIINEFDINMGWGLRFVLGSELFARTIKFMHFNTMHGGADQYFSNRERYMKYPLKMFDVLANVSVRNRPENLQYIHGAEYLGEPQHDNRPAQEIYTEYVKYRLSAYPTTLTLSHEPGYYKYTGLADYPHFDAYRVAAPHADKWGAYEKYGEKNVRWGAPLETIGDYMRTLHLISRPNPVAAWTQGVHDNWFNIWRITAGNPNNLEMRIQAYQAVANGATSLYWFNISGDSVIKNRRRLSEIQHINREFMIVGDFLTKSTPFSWVNKFMDIDLNVLAGPDFAVLFACDLKYRVSPVNQYVSSGPRRETLEFKLPEYLLSCNAAAKVSHQGVSEVDVKIKDGCAIITDTIDVTGMYVLYDTNKFDGLTALKDKYYKLLEQEKSYNFDPIRNNNDFKALRAEVMAVNGKK